MSRTTALVLGTILLFTHPSRTETRQTPGAVVDASPFYAGIDDPASLTRAVESRLALARQSLDRLLAVGGTRTVDNTLRPYDDIWRALGNARGLANIARELHPDADMRQTAERLAQTVASFNAELSLHRGVFDALAAVDAAHASPEVQHYLTRTLDTYRRDGVDKDEATRDRLTRLREELSATTQEFSGNVRDGVRRITVDSVSELDGLPADFIAARPADADGRITLTTEAPDLQPVMMYARNGDLRRRLFIESQNVAYPANLDVLARMIRAPLSRSAVL